MSLKKLTANVCARIPISKVQEKISDGYIAVASGEGRWLPGNKEWKRWQIKNLVAFLHPSGEVFIFAETVTDDGRLHRLSELEQNFPSQEEYEGFLDAWHIKMDDAHPLVQVFNLAARPCLHVV